MATCVFQYVLSRLLTPHTPLGPAFQRVTTLNQTRASHIYTPLEPANPVVTHARTPRVSHTGGPEEAHGVQGILEAYTAALNTVQLAGPTLFTEVLQTAMARANRPASQMDQRYDVLLILTDGIINDMQQVYVCVCVCVCVYVSEPWRVNGTLGI